MTIAAMTAIARQIEAAGTGYGQDDRWSFLDIAGRRIIPGRDCDCSSSAAAIVWLGGFPLTFYTGLYTGNLGASLVKAGFTELPYSASTRTIEGDLVIASYHHVIYALSSSAWLSAEGNERGSATGGTPGDQTDSEVRIRAPYDMTAGGSRRAYLYRPPADPVALSAVTRVGPQWLTINGVLDAPTVARWQSILGLESTGRLDAALVSAVQRILKARDRHGYNWRDLEVDGSGIGSNAAGRYPKVGRTHTVWALQADLGIEPDGYLSSPVSGSVKALQARLNTGRY